MKEGLENIVEIDIHDDVEDGYVQAQEDNNPKLDDLIEYNNMDDIENDDPNVSSNNINGLHSNFIDDEDYAGEDEDDYNTTLAICCSKNNIKYLQQHVNVNKDTLDEIVTDNNVNDQDF